MQVPFNPPPISTDPTPAAVVAFAAEQAGLLPLYVERVLWREWAEGQDIGLTDVLQGVALDIGLPLAASRAALEDVRLSEDLTVPPQRLSTGITFSTNKSNDAISRPWSKSPKAICAIT